MSTNPLTLCDGYKLDHRRQYPPKTTGVYSNMTARGSRVPGQERVVWLGLQGFIKRRLMDGMREFFEGDIEQIAERYTGRVNAYLGPNAIGTDHIRALHKLGYMPLRFCAFPEGSLVPLRVPMVTVENTHREFFWLTNYIETIMSCELWGTITSATTASRLRMLGEKYALMTGTDIGFVDFQFHDFSFRGMFGLDAAQLSGIGHLAFFKGTDTLPAYDYIMDYYTPKGPLWIDASVAATEHSVMCAGGQDGELATYERLLDLYPEGIVSVVSDTWDLWNVVTNILPQLKDKIMARNGKLVIRPDSGDPVKIICGDPDAPDCTPENVGLIELLYNIFGGIENSTGHRMLDPHIGAIYGDSITYERAEAILEGLAAKGFASGNIVFGVGSFTYQYVTRDTYNIAIKGTWCEQDGKGVDMFKAPKTDDGTKNSARGRLAVMRYDNVEELINCATPEQEDDSLLRPVWCDGKFLQVLGFEDVRGRAIFELRQIADWDKFMETYKP